MVMVRPAERLTKITARAERKGRSAMSEPTAKTKAADAEVAPKMPELDDDLQIEESSAENVKGGMMVRY
jgi:hypothetical protein